MDAVKINQYIFVATSENEEDNFHQQRALKWHSISNMKYIWEEEDKTNF